MLHSRPCHRSETASPAAGRGTAGPTGNTPTHVRRTSACKSQGRLTTRHRRRCTNRTLFRSAAGEHHVWASGPVFVERCPPWTRGREGYTPHHKTGTLDVATLPVFPPSVRLLFAERHSSAAV